jgi:hypothetical protein
MLYSIVFLVMIGGWLFLFTDLIKKFDRQQIDNVLLDLVKDKLDEYQDEFMIIQRIVNF